MQILGLFFLLGVINSLCLGVAVKPSRADALAVHDARLPVRTCLMERVDEKGELVHFEVRNAGMKGIWGRASALPARLRPKPLAKAGIRSYRTPATDALRVFLAANFPDSVVSDEKTFISVFVYVWVVPWLRKQGLSDLLLNHSLAKSKARGDTFMLLLHDDDGSGRLVDFYRDRGFVPCPEIIDKGMIVKIESNDGTRSRTRAQ